jgi:hypothetical protein
MFISALTRFFAPTHPQTNEIEELSQNLNIRNAAMPATIEREGFTLLKALERTAALNKIIGKASAVSLDRIAGKMTLQDNGRFLQYDLLHLAMEIYPHKRRPVQLYFVPNSPLRPNLAPEHIDKVESLLRNAREQLIIPSFAGIVTPNPPAIPYSRLGHIPYTQLPETVNAGEYQFFIPGAERIAVVRLLADIVGDDYALLPLVLTHGAPINPKSNTWLSPIWNVVKITDDIKRELERLPPLARFYHMAYEWGEFFIQSGTDFTKTVYGLAKELGLNVVEGDLPNSAQGAIRYIVSDPQSGKAVAITSSPQRTGGLECTVSWYG